MKIPAKITNFITKNKLKHEIIKHRTVYTAYDLSQTLKRKMNEVTKTLIVKADKAYVMVVLPASRQVDFKALKKILAAKKVEIGQEKLMAKLFKVKPGAISPYHAVLNKMPLVIDKTLLKAQKVVVQAGSFEESLHIKTKDFLKSVEHQLANFTKKRD